MKLNIERSGGRRSSYIVNHVHEWVNISQSIAKVDGADVIAENTVAGDILRSILGSYKNMSGRLQVEVR
jgi:hypothetical protein